MFQWYFTTFQFTKTVHRGICESFCLLLMISGVQWCLVLVAAWMPFILDKWTQTQDQREQVISQRHSQWLPPSIMGILEWEEPEKKLIPRWNSVCIFYLKNRGQSRKAGRTAWPITILTSSIGRGEQDWQKRGGLPFHPEKVCHQFQELPSQSWWLEESKWLTMTSASCSYWDSV